MRGARADRSTAAGAPPWQLRIFSRSLKKRQKLAALLRELGGLNGKHCALVTSGDNNGAMNYRFRERGGTWTWVEMEKENIPEMEALLGDPVLAGEPARIPIPNAGLDLVISIDVHEHLEDPREFNRELARVVRAGGRVLVTTPNGDPWKPVTVLKNLLGMTKEKYGHRVIGYGVRQHERMLREVGLVPAASGSYSKLFTELIELAINFAYVKILSKKGGARVREGTIAPSSAEQLRVVEKQYRLYSLAYPMLWAVSRLDLLLFFFTGYAVWVVARKP